MHKHETMWNKILWEAITKEEAISEYMSLGYSREYAETGYSQLVNDIYKSRYSLP